MGLYMENVISEYAPTCMHVIFINQWYSHFVFMVFGNLFALF